MILEIEHYSPFLQSILTESAIAAFPPEEKNNEIKSQLVDCSERLLFGDTHVGDHEMAQSCISGLWLLFGYLDESHNISQSIHTPTGSYWHAIMHRLEGDFSNSKYWYRSAGQHPVYDSIALAAGDMEAAGESVGVIVDAEMTFSPNRYVDYCQQNQGNDAARKLQQIEWQNLFEFCYLNAIGL